jgi:hypothetical protein
VLEIPLDATATRTGTGTGEPWAGTMTVQEVVHAVATLTPTGAEDFSIEPGRGIGGVHLGDSLEAVRRMYPGADAGRRIRSRAGTTLWAVGVRGGTNTGLAAIVGVAGAGGAHPPGTATVREIETRFASPGQGGPQYRRLFGSWFVRGPGRVVTEFDYGQVPRSGTVAGRPSPRVRGLQLRVGCPGTNRLLQFAGRPAADAC